MDRDQYGRALRIVTRDGESLGAALVAEGLAEEWRGRAGKLVLVIRFASDAIAIAIHGVSIAWLAAIEWVLARGSNLVTA